MYTLTYTHAYICTHRCTTHHRRQQKQNQDELLARINEETRRKLVEGGAASARTQAGGRKVSDIVTYRSPTDIPPVPSLQVLVGVDCGGGRGGVCGL